jgi:DtxR family Mn-dependent transcriptional regulator
MAKLAAMPLDRTTPAVQDYLKALCLHALETDDDLCPTSALANRLEVSVASATNMLKKLDAMGLVQHVPYKGAALTDPGRKIALEVIRHHRLLETYLAEALGVPWDQVHQEAEVLEHVLSESLEDRISALLGDPMMDPHGHPIPARDGAIPGQDQIPMDELEPGESAVVGQVSDRDPELLRYIGDLGLTPGCGVTAVSRAPFDGPLTIEVDGVEHAVGRGVAHRVLVSLPASRVR